MAALFIFVIGTAGETRVERMVAVWRDSESGALHVLPPCEVCREFLRAVDAGNLGCEVVLGRDRAVVLRELLPFWEWPEAVKLLDRACLYRQRSLVHS